MFNFKKLLKPVQLMAYSVLFIATVLFINMILEYATVNDVEYYTRLMIHELYHQEKNIDVLFLGPSRCYRALNPSITDAIFGENTFNAGSSAQCWDGSYALLVEAGKQNNLKKVYVEIGHNPRLDAVYKERKELTSTYIISDYMRPSLNKVRYLLNASGEEYWMSSFFPLRRNWKNLFNIPEVLNTLEQKRSETYRNFQYWGDIETDTEYYAGKGYVVSKRVVEDEGHSARGHFGKTQKPFSDDNVESLEKIIQYCKKNDIELVFFSSPVTDFLLADAGDYDRYIQQASDFAKAHGVEYYDFNICRREYFSYASEYYYDAYHLNMYGAEAFSILFSKFFVGEISEEELFYPSYNAKIQHAKETLYGLIYEIEKTDTAKIYTFSSVQNRPFPYKASVLKKVQGTDVCMEIQAMGKLESIQLPVDEKGELIIQVFSGDGQDIVNKISISY